MKIFSYLILTGLVCTLSTEAARIYVSSSAAEGGDGTSWATAYKYLQDGLKDAKNDDNDEIWVAAGTYYPDEGGGETDGDREATFFLRRTNTLYGGFAGTETSLDERDIDTNVTILSGAISATKAEWSRHVTKISNATIDGVTITSGNANGTESPDNEGGAIDASGTNIARNCTFIGNCAQIGGVVQGGTWTFTDCTFSNNEATVQGGVASAGTWTVTGSTFLNNTAPIGGVAFGGNWTVTDCDFTDNEATTQGGVANNGTWTVNGGTFSGNSSPQGGVSQGGTWEVTDVIFSENEATTQGGVANSGNWTVLGTSMFSMNKAPNGGVANNSTWIVNGAVFSENEATTGGGITNNTVMTVSNSVFSKNSAPLGGVSKGGGWDVKQSLFEENQATTDGGVASTGTWNVANSYFYKNSADRGGVANQGTWTVANSVFVENSAIDRGGIARSSVWTVTNSTFYKNTGNIGGIARGGTWLATNNIFYENGNNPLAQLTTNSAVYEETPAPFKERANNILDFNWSGGDMGEGFLINEDPLFIDPTDPDGADDTWGTADDGLRLLTGSPAIGVGNPAFLQADSQDVDNDGDVAETTPRDAAGFDRILDSSLDLGAYEFEASDYLLTITITPVDSGTVSDPGNGGYDGGETATMTATPAEGYQFNRWEGDATGSDNPKSLLMDGNKSVTAVFTLVPPDPVSLTTLVSPTDSGTVSDSGNGTYNEGATATLTANPASGYEFVSWAGDLTVSDNPAELIMDADKTVTAIFSLIPPTEYTLTTLVSPDNSGTVSESGDGTYEEGTTATLTANPAAGYQFDRWEGDLTGSDNPDGVTMNSNKTVTAVFTLIPPPEFALITNASPINGGTVTESGDGSYVEGTTVTITANPAAGFFFDYWDGDLTGSENPAELTMDAAKDVTAVFALIPPPVYTLTTSVSPADTGTISQSGDGSYVEGTNALITANPADGYLFDRWEGDLTGSENPATLPMNGNKSVTAIFALIPPPSYNLTTNVSPSETGTITESGDGSYVEGTTATVTANPADGYLFEKWEGDLTGTDNPADITMDADKSIAAIFALIPPPNVSLTVNISPENAGTTSDNGNGTYPQGDTATISAFPADGFLFDRWEGDASSSDNPLELLMSSNKEVTAIFVAAPPETATLTTSVTPDGTGTVTDNGGGIYAVDDNATITAVPADGYLFERWEGDLTGSTNPETLAMNTDKQVTAVFVEAPPEIYTLTKNASPEIGGSVQDNGGGSFEEGTTATIEAVPADGYQFDAWEGDAFGTSNPIEIVMDQNKSVTALFSLIPPPTYTLTKSVSPDSTGTIQESGNGTYDENSIATLEATPADGYQFDGWEGDATGTSNPIQVTMDSNKVITAKFSLIPTPKFTLTKIVKPEESGEIQDSGNGSYDENSIASAEAIPAPGYQFDYWEGDATGTNNPIDLFMDEDKQITAVFSVIPPSEYTLTTYSSPEDGGTVDGNDASSYTDGSTVSLEATPAPGYLFEGWNGDANGEVTSVDVSMDGNKTVTAIFVKDESDADFDGLSAFVELSVYGSNPNNDDTDGDGIKDGVEAGTIFNPAVDDTPTLQLLATNPEFYLGLALASNAIVPEILIERTETDDFVVTIQIEKTDNLKDWEALDLSNASINGDTISLTIPATDSVRFLRSRSSR